MITYYQIITLATYKIYIVSTYTNGDEESQLQLCLPVVYHWKRQQVAMHYVYTFHI